jgi:hypothetical protein
LPDAAFAPLLDVSASLAIARAGSYASTHALSRALRVFLAAAADYARTGATNELAPGLAAVLVGAEAGEVLAALAGAATPEARAADLASVVARTAGLGRPSP